MRACQDSSANAFFGSTMSSENSDPTPTPPANTESSQAPGTASATPPPQATIQQTPDAQGQKQTLTAGGSIEASSKDADTSAPGKPVIVWPMVVLESEH